MNRAERTMIFATLAVLAGGAIGWFALGGPSKGGVTPAGEGTGTSSNPGAPPVAPPKPLSTTGSSSDPSMLSGAPGGGGELRPGMRTPSGEDYSNPAVARAALHTALGADFPDWAKIAEIVGVIEGPLDTEVRQTLEASLLRGNAAGALQAYARVRDGTVVGQLLHDLDDRAHSDLVRQNLLLAISSIPGADAKEAVTGIEGRTTHDLAHDLPYLQAIARIGGVEGARAIADAVTQSTDPTKFGVDVWREFDFRKSKDASDQLASVIKAETRPEALRALADFAGRPGASPDLVGALLALGADGQPDAVRRQAYESLARTGDDKAVEKLLDVAARRGEDGTVAARALSSTTTLSEPARTRLLAAVSTSTDDELRRHAIVALGNVRAVSAVPALSTLAVSGSDSVRNEAVTALGRIGPQAASSTEALKAAYIAGDEAMRGNVAIALGQIGTPEAKRLVDELRVAEKSDRVQRILNAVIIQWSRPKPQ